MKRFGRPAGGVPVCRRALLGMIVKSPPPTLKETTFTVGLMAYICALLNAQTRTPWKVDPAPKEKRFDVAVRVGRAAGAPVETVQAFEDVDGRRRLNGRRGQSDRSAPLRRSDHALDRHRVERRLRELRPLPLWRRGTRERPQIESPAG